MHRNKHRLAVYAFILGLIVSTGCTGLFGLKKTPEKRTVVKGEQFLLVTANADDSLASLAEAYLNDAEKGWWIARYNQIESVSAGQQIVIPLMPVTYGGLSNKGYQTVPVLLYTHMAHHPSHQKSIASGDFDRQVNYLRENDFVTISLDQFYAFLNIDDHLPPNAVLITFDSADRWVYDIAFPILERNNMKAALFIPSEEIGRKGKMTWPQLATMASQGISIGVHGSAIPSLNGKGATALDRYIGESKKRIESHLKRPCHDFSSPLQEIDDLTTAILKKHGYRTGLTRKPGQNPFFAYNFNLHRSIIYGHDNLHQFGRNLITFNRARLQ